MTRQWEWLINQLTQVQSFNVNIIIIRAKTEIFGVQAARLHRQGELRQAIGLFKHRR